MITLYTGTPGSGKSLRACYTIWDRVKAGRNTITNFPVDTKKITKKEKGKVIYIDNEDLTPDLLIDYAMKNHKHKKESQTLIILDECSIMFNSREWDKKDRTKWVKFFQLHRKLGYDIIMITQNERLIDRQIRAFIETEWKHRAIKNYNNFAKILSFSTGGMFVAIEYWYVNRIRVSDTWFRYHKRKANIYDTFLNFQ